MSLSAGCLGAFFFKHTVVDRMSKAIEEAENVTAGLVISEFCISVTVLVLASNETCLKHNLAELNTPLICNKFDEIESAAVESSDTLKVSDFSTPADTIATEPCSIPPSVSIATELPRSTPPDVTISPNSIANDSYCTPPSTTCSAICTQILPTLGAQNTKRLSIDSNTTLVDHNDDFMKGFFDADLHESTIPQDDSGCSSSDLLPGTKALTISDSSGPSQRPGTQLQPIILEDGHLMTTDILLLVDASTQTIATPSLGSIPPQIVMPQLKPPDTKQHQNFRPGRHKVWTCLLGSQVLHSPSFVSTNLDSLTWPLSRVRGSIECTYTKQLEQATVINDLEQLHDNLLADQTALVDGWAAAMAELGLASMLSPALPLLDQKMPDPGNLITSSLKL
ncbi:hypothetical protein EV424DRAFT_1348405 [Suillus variegatus]|nr:hypothetical protein EV424DRAFT_1348405 [Suillus variegatus]